MAYFEKVQLRKICIVLLLGGMSLQSVRSNWLVDLLKASISLLISGLCSLIFKMGY